MKHSMNLIVQRVGVEEATRVCNYNEYGLLLLSCGHRRE